MPVQNLKSNLDMMRINPAHISQFDNGFVLDNRHITTIYDTEPPEHVVYVSPNFNDDEDNFKFSTIQGAIDYIYGSSWYSSLDGRNKAVIVVYPGVYTEQIHAYADIVITSSVSGIDPVSVAGMATIYSSGADSNNYPLSSDEDGKFEMVGMNIKTDSGGVFGKIPDGKFVNCYFHQGHFIERDNKCLSIFSSSNFYGSPYGGFKLEGTNLDGFRNLLFRGDCRIGSNITPIFTSTHTGFANLQWDNVLFKGAATVGGNWDWTFRNGRGFGSSGRNSIDTTGDINIINTIMANGLHFVSDPGSFSMVNSTFHGIELTEIPAGECDITADVVITGSYYFGNSQFNGLSGKIQIQCPIKSVGCSALNRYFSVQDAIDSIPASESGVVDLQDSFTGLAELVLPAGADVSIDGHKLYSLTFTGDIVEVGANGRIGFMDMVGVTGGNIEMNGAGAEISIESCQYVTGYVTLTNGAFAILYKSSFFGSTGHKAINVNTIDPIIVIGYSRCQGATGHEAVTFSVDADDKFKAKYSTFIHGDKDASEPLTYTGATGKVDIACYNCGLNAAWNPAKLYNTIGSANNTTDVNITF